jgi:replicative DNA helicase
MTDDDWTRLARRTVDISEAPLLLNCTPGADLDALCAEIVSLGEREPLKLIAVDPINMIRVRTEPGANRERELSLVTRRLKTLALELDIPVIVTAELGRTVDTRADHRPTLSDLREADVVAQVADIAILLHRPDYYERDDPRAGEADLIVMKHREGPTATITVAHQLHYSRFTDLAIG